VRCFLYRGSSLFRGIWRQLAAGAPRAADHSLIITLAIAVLPFLTASKAPASAGVFSTRTPLPPIHPAGAE